jgi:hypothetical protein
VVRRSPRHDYQEIHPHRRLLATSAGATLGAAAPASADTGTTAAIAAAAGLIVGGLLFDNNRNQYYYVNGGQRRYVNEGVAREWYRRHDGAYYNARQNEFRTHRFASNWQRAHTQPAPRVARGAAHGPMGDRGHGHDDQHRGDHR